MLWQSHQQHSSFSHYSGRPSSYITHSQWPIGYRSRTWDQLVASNPGRRAAECNPRASCLHTCASVTEQYNFVPVNGRWFGGLGGNRGPGGKSWHSSAGFTASITCGLTAPRTGISSETLYARFEYGTATPFYSRTSSLTDVHNPANDRLLQNLYQERARLTNWASRCFVLVLVVVDVVRGRPGGRNDLHTRTVRVLDFLISISISTNPVTAFGIIQDHYSLYSAVSQRGKSSRVALIRLASYAWSLCSGYWVDRAMFPGHYGLINHSSMRKVSAVGPARESISTSGVTAFQLMT